MSSDPTRETLQPHIEVLEDDEIDWDDDLLVTGGPSNSADPQPEIHSVEEAGTDKMDVSGEDVAPKVEPVVTEAEDREMKDVGENSAAQAGTVVAEADDREMKDVGENSAAQAGTAGAEAGDQMINELSSNLNRVLNSEVTSSGHAAALYFSRAMDNIVQSKANAGILPGSSNRFDALREPVHASRALNFAQVSQLADQLLAQPSKRLRSSSADSSRPNKSARTEPEPEDTNMDETAPEEPFNFREIVDPKSSSQCYIRVNDGDWFGAVNGQLPNYKITVHIQGGRMGVPWIKLCFSIAKKEFFNKPLDKGKATGAFEELFCIWQPGLILDPTNPKYQISDLVISHPLDRNPQVEMPESLARTKSDLLTKVVGLSFFSESVTLEGAKRQKVNHMNSDLLKTLDEVRLQPREITIWYVPPPGGAQNHVQRTLKHFQMALERRLPPLHQYLVPPTWELNVDMDLLPIRYFQGGMYCKYPEVNKVEDDNQDPLSFRTLPVKTFFQTNLEFQIYYSVGTIREYQWQRGQMAHIVQRPHGIYLQKTFRLQNGKATRSDSLVKHNETQTQFRNSFYAYVIMTPNEQGQTESVPPEGAMFNLDWANSAGQNGTHVWSLKQEQWIGKVCTVDSTILRRLQAQFCLIVTKPPRGERQKSYKTISPGQDLPSAYLTPIFTKIAATREVDAVHQFCNTTREDLELIRLSVVADPEHGITDYTDLRGGPDRGQDWQRNVKKFSASLDARRGRFNPAQIKVLESAGSVANKLVVVKGPPGSGKTSTIAELVDLLTEVGHTILISCASNGAVDENAHKLWKVRPKGKKILRLEVTATDQAKTLERTEKDYSQPDLSLPAVTSRAESWKQDPIYLDMLTQLATAEIAVEQGSTEADLFLEAAGKLKADYETLYEPTSKNHDFPRGMSMAYRIWELVQADLKATNDFELQDTAMNRAIARSQGSLPRPYDPSMKYRHLLEQYHANNGELSGGERKSLRQEYENQVARVIQETDILLTTCNNSGSDMVRDIFRPSVLIIDEAGQATVPATLVPMTTYADWMATFLVGDERQLQPMVTSGAGNEFEENFKISLFALVIEKGVSAIMLDLQYRMCPEISSFPSRHFYDAKLFDAESVKQDNPIRQMVRDVSLQDYKIKGPNGNGNEYWMIDVARGVSRREENGPSLQNFANATVIIDLMRKLIRRGVPKSAIQVLTFYRGQIKTVFRTAHEVPQLDDITGISTVDSYQGREAQVVILDLVIAYTNATKYTEGLDLVYDVATKHVRNPHRMCVGLTRAHYGLIVISNATAMGRGNKGSEAYRTLASLLVDANDRGLLHVDSMTPDTHPDAIARAAQDLEYRKQVAAEMNLIDHLTFIHDIVRNKHQLAKKSQPMRNQRPVSYRLGTKAPTTLPHVDEALRAKMRTPAKNKPTPPWVDKNKPRVEYDNSVRWEQSLQQSEANNPQGPSGDQSHKDARQDKGKQRMQSPENTDRMDDSQSPEQVRDDKGKQPTQSPERTDPMEDDQPPEDGSEEGEVGEHSAASGSNNTSRAPPPNVAPPKQRGQRLQPTPDMEWRRGAGSGNVRGLGGRGGPRGGGRGGGGGGGRGGGRGGGGGGGRGTGRGGKGRGGNPRGGQSSAGRA